MSSRLLRALELRKTLGPADPTQTLTGGMQPDLNCGDMDWHRVVI